MAIKRYEATKDNTITNAFKQDLVTRGTGSNIGQSDILEVFSIYAQATSGSSELSRILIQFPVSGSSTGEIKQDRDDGNIPASGIIANEPTLAGDPSYVELVGDLNAGYIVADVPVTVVVQNALPSFVPTIRSQNGTTTTSIVNDDDETLTLGFTPSNIKTELTKDVDGYTRRREIDASGVVTYPLV